MQLRMMESDLDKQSANNWEKNIQWFRQSTAEIEVWSVECNQG